MRPKVNNAAATVDHVRQLKNAIRDGRLLYYIIIIIIIMCNAAATATAVTTVWAGGHADDRPLEGRLGCDVDLVRAIYLGENKREKIKIVPNNKNKMKTTSDFYNNYYTQ